MNEQLMWCVLLYIELLKQDRNAISARPCMASDTFVTSVPISLPHANTDTPMKVGVNSKNVPIADIIGVVSPPTNPIATVEP